MESTTFALVLLVFINVILPVDALNSLTNINNEFKVDSKRVENLFSQKVLREIQSVREGDVNKYVRNFESFQSVQANGSSCVCSGYNCGCCADLKWDVIHLDDTVCVNVSYLPAPEYGISATLTVDGKTIINETVSARNPPPLCVDVPYLKEYASLCIRLSQITVTPRSFSACASIEAEVFKIKVEEINLGCFTIPPNVKVTQGSSDGPLLWSKGSLKSVDALKDVPF
ncbi:uncharacterized protein LOC127847654 [Dreissena polymorpha]|uniref:uncharacterized protein LOC127847654 n=1 Tax=Dreissena polymorpha TaxID=45954 RepID=UPI002263CB27|nr:uncharacterized protein LOC127847654 [Dreissena polymorpha]